MIFNIYFSHGKFKYALIKKYDELKCILKTAFYAMYVVYPFIAINYREHWDLFKK